MKRRALFFIWTMILLFSFLFTGCKREEIDEGGKLDPAGQIQTESEEPWEDVTEDLTDSSAAPSADAEIDRAWEVLQEARKNMASLKAVEENQILYTKIDGADDSISLRVTVTDIDTGKLTIGAAGTVKTKGNAIPLEIYYKDGVMVRISGGNSAKTEATQEEALANVDFLRSIRRDLKKEDLTSASMFEAADGMITISLQFSGTISGLPTTGRGELLLDADHLIASEGYSFEATNKDGKPVSQSVECTLLCWDQDVKAVELPGEFK
ncbi:MAG: hypothetical protein J5865_00030 [Lachnospiraceae bacterium]|nr:hypothetical protein [Lachnospiraceae bacterium]